jgi:hypothetical protein
VKEEKDGGKTTSPMGFPTVMSKRRFVGLFSLLIEEKAFFPDLSQSCELGSEFAFLLGESEFFAPRAGGSLDLPFEAGSSLASCPEWIIIPRRDE